MARSGKMLAEPLEPQKISEGEATASELASASERDIDPYVGLGLRKRGKVTLLRESEITDDDMLMSRRFIESFPSKSSAERWLKRKLLKRGIAIGLIPFVASVTAVSSLVLALNGIIEKQVFAAMFVSSIYPLLMFVVMGFISGVKPGYDFMEKIAPGSVRAPEGFTRVDGSYYNVETPGYEELHEAITLLGEVSSSHERQMSASSRLRELRKSRKDKETLQLIEKLNRELDESVAFIKKSEERIAELLASDEREHEKED